MIRIEPVEVQVYVQTSDNKLCATLCRTKGLVSED